MCHSGSSRWSRFKKTMNTCYRKNDSSTSRTWYFWLSCFWGHFYCNKYLFFRTCQNLSKNWQRYSFSSRLHWEKLIKKIVFKKCRVILLRFLWFYWQELQNSVAIAIMCRVISPPSFLSYKIYCIQRIRISLITTANKADVWHQEVTSNWKKFSEIFFLQNYDKDILVFLKIFVR